MATLGRRLTQQKAMFSDETGHMSGREGEGGTGLTHCAGHTATISYTALVNHAPLSIRTRAENVVFFW